ncbi:hypothetical protein, partial [Rahnella woolbedingensis]
YQRIERSGCHQNLRAFNVLPLQFLVAGIAYGNYSGENTPDFVNEAVATVSNKMSYSFGTSTCKIIKNEEKKWHMACNSPLVSEPLLFTVQAAEKSPYDISTSFYLTAENTAAKKASDEGLMSYLMINKNSAL